MYGAFTGRASPGGRRLLVLSGVCLALGGCIDPDYGAEPFLCAARGECPDGYLCRAGRCVGSATLPPSDAGPPEQPPAEQGPADGSRDGPLVPGQWVVVEAATFTMGSPEDEPCRSASEAQHQVTLGRPFAIMAHQVTRAMFSAMVGYAPADRGCGDDCPVVDVTWHEAAALCNALSVVGGLEPCYGCAGEGAAVRCEVPAALAGAKIYGCPGLRLPTEAEWELACRAGSQTALYNGPLSGCAGSDDNADAIAWYLGNAGGVLHPVGQKAPNAWGLHDMLGNAWDWCHDRFTETLGGASVTDPVFFDPSVSMGTRRGGSFGSAVQYLRVANRASQSLDERRNGTGLRCVRSLP